MPGMRVFLVFICFVAACGGSSKGTNKPTVEDPERSLTQAECEQAVDHVIALPTDESTAGQSQALKSARQERVSECLKVGKKKDFDCVMGAKTWDDLGQCPAPEQPPDSSTPDTSASPTAP